MNAAGVSDAILPAVKMLSLACARVLALPLTPPACFCFHSDESAAAEYSAPCSKGERFILLPAGARTPSACPSNLLHKILAKCFS